MTCDMQHKIFLIKNARTCTKSAKNANKWLKSVQKYKKSVKKAGFHYLGATIGTRQESRRLPYSGFLNYY